MVAHPIHDLGPELLKYTLEQFNAVLTNLRNRTDLSKRTIIRIAQYTLLVERYERIVPLLTAFCLQQDLGTSGDQPEKLIRKVLEAADEEPTEELLDALSCAVSDLLQLAPKNDDQVKAKSMLPPMLMFYQMTHQIFFYFIETPL